MKKLSAYFLFWLAGVLFEITAIISFIGHNTTQGFAYLALGCTFITLGFANKSKVGKK